MYYVIRPMTGWEEGFSNKEAALERAIEIINSDEGGIQTIHNYEKPEQLVQEIWESLDEMYQALTDSHQFYPFNI